MTTRTLSLKRSTRNDLTVAHVYAVPNAGAGAGVCLVARSSRIHDTLATRFASARLTGRAERQGRLDAQLRGKADGSGEKNVQARGAGSGP